MTRLATKLLAAAAVAVASPADAATYAEAQAAYTSYDVDGAGTLYRTIADDPAATRKDRAAARRELARIAWLVDGNQPRAATLLAASLPDDPDPCPAALLYGRVLNAGQARAQVPGLLAPYGPMCADIEPGIAVEAVRALYLDAVSMPPQARAKAIAGASAAWRAMPKQSRERGEGARLRLSIGLAGGDAAEALAGWQDYFWLTGTAAPQAFGQSDAEVRALFQHGVGPSAAPADAMAMAALLVRAGFGDELRRFAADHGLAEQTQLSGQWKPIASYLALRTTLEREILAHDRAYARNGPADEDGYEQRLHGILRKAAADLGSKSDDPMPALNRAYGLWGVVGKTNGVMSLHLGHSVVDERQPVAQYGRNGYVRFIALDNMISNAFSAWLFDGASAPGGWAVSGDTIVQVRPVYVSRIDDLVAVIRPGQARDRYLADIRESSARDDEIVKKTPITFLPGLRLRLRLQAIDRLAATLPQGNGFDTAFRRAYWDAIVGSAITLHEGRHVLDQAQFRGDAELSASELEYRAKLSEIGLSRTPRIALASVYSSLFGGTTGHGIANKRIVEDYVAWMSKHTGEIAGYDAARPPLVQLDKLTDTQIQTIARELDPASRSGGEGRRLAH